LSDASGTGRLILILGPSGVGKDTLIDGLRAQYEGDSRVLFARRTITRPAGDASEQHDPLTTAAFLEKEAQGAFAVTWEANGLYYGLPRDLLDHVAGGGVGIANGSRGALTDIRSVFRNLTVVLIEVSPDELARRLRARGRETEAEIVARLERARTLKLDDPDVIRIDNSGPPADGVAVLADIVPRHLR